MKLANYVGGRWVEGTGTGTRLVDPVLGDELATASTEGVDLGAALDYARRTGGPALRKLSYGERAALLGKIVEVLNANKEKYQATAQANSGNTKADAAIDIDGGIGTLFFFSRLGAKLGDKRALKDGGFDRLGKDEAFQAMHLAVPLQGVAIHINAFNFPSWGLWEKAAVALLAGVPVLAKPATATALLSYQMVKDVVDAGVLPEGALSLVCGSARDLLDHVTGQDAIAFTGSADTAHMLRANRHVIESGVRFNVEADSLNSSLLGPDATDGSPEFDLFVREVAREMTQKAGQKCTAIRRAFVPRALIDKVSGALEARLAKTVVGNPRNESVTMGPVVNRTQQKAVLDAIERLSAESKTVVGGPPKPVDADPEVGCFVAPTLLRCDDPASATAVHSVEAFGPACTLMPYDSAEQAITLAARGGGSLAASVFTADDKFAADAALGLAASHGRVLVVDDKVGKSSTGHGIVMPSCVHGGPGRAGGGEELGGLRGLRFYHQRLAVQGRLDRLQALAANAAEVSL
ncbi:MAG TPA: 3,4-dehydroadipyl-CoA semialdehyde dehydrogenase [Alphaproteobacteria bacterium]